MAVPIVMRIGLIRKIGSSVRVVGGVPGGVGILRSVLEVARRTVVIAMACRVDGIFISLAGVLLSGAGGSIVMIGVVLVFISMTVPVTSL